MAGHRWQYGACALHAGYLRLQIRTLRLCNTRCLSTATMVAQTRLNVSLYLHGLPCLKKKKRVIVRNMKVMLFGSGGCAAITGCNYNETWRWHSSVHCENQSVPDIFTSVLALATVNQRHELQTLYRDK